MKRILKSVLIIADYERENPYFKEAVKLAITPLISSLSILNYVNMDSIPELVKLGYSSTKGTATLNRWIITNDYLKDLQTEYFQILCKNCNGAKSDYGKCPMKNKPH